MTTRLFSKEGAFPVYQLQDAASERVEVVQWIAVDGETDRFSPLEFQHHYFAALLAESELVGLFCNGAAPRNRRTPRAY